jgi:hypothetical protein
MTDQTNPVPTVSAGTYDEMCAAIHHARRHARAAYSDLDEFECEIYEHWSDHLGELSPLVQASVDAVQEAMVCILKVLDAVALAEEELRDSPDPAWVRND